VREDGLSHREAAARFKVSAANISLGGQTNLRPGPLKGGRIEYRRTQAFNLMVLFRYLFESLRMPPEIPSNSSATSAGLRVPAAQTRQIKGLMLRKALLMMHF
jgi:hypothetical protein